MPKHYEGIAPKRGGNPGHTPSKRKMTGNPHPEGKGKPFAGHKAPPFRSGQVRAPRGKF